MSPAKRLAEIKRILETEAKTTMRFSLSQWRISDEAGMDTVLTKIYELVKAKP